MKLWKARSPQPIAVNRRQITGPERKKLLEENIPIGVEVAGQWAWRILAIVAVLVVFGLLISALREIVVPFMVAILLAALLVPIKNSLVRHGWPKWLAVALVMVGTIAIIGGLVFLIVIQVRSGLPELQKQSVGAFDNLKAYLLASPLHLTDAQIT
ncbi:MAG: family transporter, partial [Glaciihabitans sp.]|nr:family transporter [Glaciihabitans sp.]